MSPSIGDDCSNRVVRYPASDRLSLRLLEANDAELRVRWMSDPRVFAKMAVPRGITVEGTKRWIEETSGDPSRLDLVAIELETGTPVGMLGARGVGSESGPELHILVDPDRHSAGLGTESLALLLEYLDQVCPRSHAWLKVDPTNVKALALYQRFGFVAESHLEDRVIMRRS